MKGKKRPMEQKWEEIWGIRARELFLSFGDPLFIVEDEEILDCNPKAAQLFGTSRQEMKGMRYFQLCPQGERAREIFEPRFQKALEKGEDRFQAILHKRDGEEFFSEVTIQPIPREEENPLFLVHIRDITQKKEMERRLRESEETLREFVEKAPLGIFRTTPDGKVLYANPKLLEIFGVNHEDLGKVDLRDKVYKNPKDRDRFVSLLLEKGRVENFQVQVKKRDGSTLWVSLYARTVKDEDGKVKYFEGAFLDITEEKQLEAQLQEIRRMEALGTLVGGIAHQFNNILTGIIGYAELASIKVPSDDPVIKDLENIKEGARRAAELVRKLAAFGRKAILKLQKTHINRLVVDQVPLVESLLPQDIKLKIRIDPHMEAVEVDPEAIKDILFNLCKNAVEAMPQGGTLTLETRTYTVDQDLVRRYPWLEEGTYGALIVRDTGRGIEERVMSHIFEPFFTTKEVGEGTGLGLSMVYGLIKQHRGAIIVKSQPGKGSEFTVLFPMAKTPDLLEEKRESYLPFQPGMDKRLILLVEDEEPVRKVIRETLEGGGCQVLEASSGKEALEILRQTHREIDLAILDLILPGMNGKEVGQKVQELFPHTRILFISGYSQENLHPKHRPEEGQAFLQKPFTPTELLKKVGELMK